MIDILPYELINIICQELELKDIYALRQVSNYLSCYYDNLIIKKKAKWEYEMFSVNKTEGLKCILGKDSLNEDEKLIIIKHMIYLGLSVEKNKKIILFQCFLRGYLKILTYLISTGYNFSMEINNDINNKNYATLIHIACDAGNLNMIKYIFDHYNDILSSKIGNFLPQLILQCLIKNYHDIIEYLLSYYSFSEKHINYVFLKQVFNYKGMYVVKNIQKSFDIPFTMRKFMTEDEILYCIFSNKSLKFVIYLINLFGFDLKIGEKMLWVVSMFGNIKVFYWIISLGIDIKNITADKNIILNKACLHNHNKIAIYITELLINSGISIKSIFDNIDLSVIFDPFNIEYIRYLFNKGIIINDIPWQNFSKCFHGEILPFLLEKNIPSSYIRQNHFVYKMLYYNHILFCHNELELLIKYRDLVGEKVITDRDLTDNYYKLTRLLFNKKYSEEFIYNLYDNKTLYKKIPFHY